LDFVHTKQNDSYFTREIWFGFLEETGVHAGQIGTGDKDYISIAVNPESGQPAVAYLGEYDELVFAQLRGEVWQNETVYHFGRGLSLAFDPEDNRPAIAFNSTGDYNLYYAKFKGSKWKVSNISWNDACFESLCFNPKTGDRSISYKTLGWTNHPSRLYYDGGRGGSYVDGDPNYVGDGNSLAFDKTGDPHITYFDHTDHFLKHAWRKGTKWDKEVVDVEVDGSITSLVIPGDNTMYVSYTDTHSIFEEHLKLAYFDGNDWTIETLFSSDDISDWSSLTLDALNRPCIAFIAADKAWVMILSTGTR
jgi:hypothetical protein